MKIASQPAQVSLHTVSASSSALGHRAAADALAERLTAYKPTYRFLTLAGKLQRHAARQRLT